MVWVARERSVRVPQLIHGGDGIYFTSRSCGRWRGVSAKPPPATFSFRNTSRAVVTTRLWRFTTAPAGQSIWPLVDTISKCTSMAIPVLA